MLIAAYRPMNIVWHPIMFQDEVTEFNEPWIFPLIIPMDSKECTVFMPGCFKRNWFIKNEKIVDGDYYVTVDDDDMYEDGVFDAIKQINDDIVIISMKRGYQIPTNTLSIKQYPVWSLFADPHWVKIGMISAQQSFVMGRIFRQHLHNEKSHNWDGELIVRHKEAEEQIGYRIDLFALFNYFEPGRWIKQKNEGKKVSIIIPIIRPEKAKRCIKMIYDNAGIDRKYYEIITGEDKKRIGAPLMFKKLVKKAQYKLICFLGDDALPQPDFLKNAIKTMNELPNKWGLVGFNDNTGRTLPTHWIADKRLLPYLDGEFFHTGYKHCFCDNELQERTNKLNRYIYAVDAIVLHDHPLLMHTKTDKDYERVYSKEYLNHDRKLFEQRYHLWREQKKDIIISNQKISVIIPIIRPESAERCIEAIKKNAGLPFYQYEIVTLMDTDGIGCPKMVETLIEKAEYDLVMFLGDDTLPEPDFLKYALEAMESLPDGWGVVGLNTQDIRIEGGNPLAHWLAHKKMLEHIPGGAFFSTEYKHCWGDNELKDIADELGRWIHAEKSKIQHVHPVNQSAENDEGYQRAYTKENQHHDFRTYCSRKRIRMQKKYGTKLAIAVPLTDEMVYRHFFFSFVKVIIEYMISLVEKGKSISFDVLMPDFPCQVDAARNNLVNQALLLGCTHILMMDTDQIYATTNMIEKMLAHNKPVVGARVHRRYPPYDPLLLRGDIGKLYQIPENEIKKPDGTFESELDVTYTGTGCILYDMQIFNDMIPEKWFQFKVGDVGQPIGEDIVFCEKLRDRKIPIIVDCNIDIKHLTLLASDWGTYKLFSKLMGGKNHVIRKH